MEFESSRLPDCVRSESPRRAVTSAVQRRIEERAHSMELDLRDSALLAGTSVSPALGDLSERSAGPSRFERALDALAEGVYRLRIPLRLAFVGLTFYLFAFNLSVVRGSSMAPGIHDGDRILVDQFSYLFDEVQRGDIVVLRYPLDPSVDYIKRVVGLPGDELVMAGGALWINGERFEEDYIQEADLYTHTVTRVKSGHYFVLGDNRLHSSDSREFGQVPADLLRGRVDLRLWPPGRIGQLD